MGAICLMLIVGLPFVSMYLVARAAGVSVTEPRATLPVGDITKFTWMMIATFTVAELIAFLIITIMVNQTF